MKKLPLRRDAIERRTRTSRRIAADLDLLAEDRESRAALFRCRRCDTRWQRANTPSGEPYLFRVPRITVEDWASKHFVSPLEMLVYSVRVASHFRWQRPVETEHRCVEAGCERRAIQFSVQCVEHEVLHYQSLGQLPALPDGRVVPGYSRFGIVGLALVDRPQVVRPGASPPRGHGPLDLACHDDGIDAIYTISFAPGSIPKLASAIEAQGHAANGYAVEAAMMRLAEKGDPPWASELEFDSENDLFAVRCTRRLPLVRLARRLERRLNDPSALRRLVKSVEFDR